MSVLTPYRPQVRAGNDGFVQLLAAEWTKFRTVRGWVIGLIVGGLLIVGLGALTGANSICSSAAVTPGNPNPVNTACPAPPAGPGGEWVSDAFYFVRRPLTGNGSITARVTSLTGLYSTHGGIAGAGGNPLAGMTPGVQPWSKAGLIIKASTARGSAYAAMMVTGTHGVRMQWNFTHDVAGLSGKVSAASPRWLRLTKSGDMIRGYDSPDGRHWTLVGTAILDSLPASVQGGLFAATSGYTKISHSLGSASELGGPALAAGVFDRLSTRGSWSPGQWSGQSIQGATDNALPPQAQGFTRSGGKFKVSGSGDIAPYVGDSGSGQGGALAGVFVAMIALIVIGVVFITAEFRRGLIRTTFTASPRRARVLAAKALVLGAVTFAVSLAAIAIAIPLTDHLLRGNGNPIFPLPALTLLRIEAGMAALLALCAVLALAVGALIRRSAIAVTVVIAGIVLPYLLAVLPGVLPSGAEEWLVRITPAAAFAIQQTSPAYPQVLASYTPGTGYYPLGPWAGFAVLCAWTAAVLAFAAYMLRRRDA
jgi:ABC-type transport system involved in multi-copper enzyme maturation permease subunit